MKRALLLLMPAVLLLAIVAGCDDDDVSQPSFTRLRVTPACGVVPMEVEGYAILSGGNETGDPLGGNNNLDVKWSFGDGGTGVTTLAYHQYFTAGEFNVTVTGTDPDGNIATATYPVLVLPDSLVVGAGSNFPDGNVTTADTVRFEVSVFTCDIDYPVILGDSVKVEILWEMGDVDDTVYRVMEPAFKYTTPGQKEATLTVFYPAWAVERKQTLVFEVADVPIP